MAEEYSKDQTAQLVFNAEIKKDIDTIKNTLSGIQIDLKIYAQQFVPNSLFLEHKKEAEKLFDGVDRRIRFLERYAWAAIGALFLIELYAKIAPLIHISN